MLEGLLFAMRGILEMVEAGDEKMEAHRERVVAKTEAFLEATKAA
jgi:hypothetical protein